MELQLMFSRDDVSEILPYELICSTMYSSQWNTGRCFRAFNATFSNDEQAMIQKISRQSHDWYLGRGVPSQVILSPQELVLWHRLAQFCITI